MSFSLFNYLSLGSALLGTLATLPGTVHQYDKPIKPSMAEALIDTANRPAENN